MIVKAKVIDTYEIMLQCDNCGKIMSTRDFDMKSRMYKYVCDCGHEEQSKLCYPFTLVTYDRTSMQAVTEEEVMNNG